MFCVDLKKQRFISVLQHQLFYVYSCDEIRLLNTANWICNILVKICLQRDSKNHCWQFRVVVWPYILALLQSDPYFFNFKFRKCLKVLVELCRVKWMKSVEIKCQLDATDDFYCRSYCLLNMFRAALCPSSGAREYYTGGCCLWYLVLWF